MPSLSVIRRLQAEYLRTVALGSIPACCLWAHAPITLEPPWDLVRTPFAGGWGLEEGPDRGRTRRWATDPLGDFTVSCTVVDTHEQAPRASWRQARQDRGRPVAVVMPEGAPLSKDSLPSSWADVEPQRCIVHVIQAVHQLILAGVRAIPNRLKRQGTPGRTQRRGRPSQKAQQQRQRRTGMSKQAHAPVVWDHPYLLVRTQADRSEQDKQALALLGTLAPDLKLLRQCHQQFERLFARDISKAWAHARRTRRVNQAPYQANAFLAKALKEAEHRQVEPHDRLAGMEGWRVPQHAGGATQPELSQEAEDARHTPENAHH